MIRLDITIYFNCQVSGEHNLINITDLIFLIKIFEKNSGKSRPCGRDFPLERQNKKLED